MSFQFDIFLLNLGIVVIRQTCLLMFIMVALMVHLTLMETIGGVKQMMVKAAVTRFGGARGYQRVKPLMVGQLAGLVSLLIGTGERPVPFGFD